MGKTQVEDLDATIYRTKFATIYELNSAEGFRLFGIRPDYDMPQSQGQNLVALIFGDELGPIKAIKQNSDTVEGLRIKQTLHIHERGGVVYTTSEKTGALKFITVALKFGKTVDL